MGGRLKIRMRLQPNWLREEGGQSGWRRRAGWPEPQTCEEKAGMHLSVPLGSRLFGKTKPNAHPEHVPRLPFARKERDVLAQEEGQLRSLTQGDRPKPSPSRRWLQCRETVL